MQDAQGSIAKDTIAVCAATLLFVALLIGAAILWPSPPPRAPAVSIRTAEATPQTPLYVF